MELELSPQSLNRLADQLSVMVASKVVPIIKAKLAEENRLQEWITTEEAAAILGITPKYLRETKDRYPYIKNGDKPQGCLRFLRSALVENFAK